MPFNVGREPYVKVCKNDICLSGNGFMKLNQNVKVEHLLMRISLGPTPGFLGFKVEKIFNKEVHDVRL